MGLRTVRIRRVAFAIVVFAVRAVVAQSSSDIKLNTAAVEFASQLIQQGHAVADHKGDWSEHRPSPTEQNKFIRVSGFSAYAKWHLGIDERYAAIPSADTNSRTAILKTSTGVVC